MALRTFVLPVALTLGGLATAQDLAQLLPEETFLALGMRDLEGASAQLEDFSAEFRRLDLVGALTALSADQGMMSGGTGSGGAGEVGMDRLPDEARRALETFGSLDVLGQEAWIALSASSVSPLPALTMVTRVTPEGAEKVQALLADAGMQGVEELEESGATFFQIPLNGAEPLQVLAYTLTDDLLALSTNPDALRGILRRHAGADEPSFANAEGYSDTLGTLDEGTFYSFFDYARLAEVAAPYTQNLGFDPLVNRLSKAFATAGTVGGVVRLTDDALVSESLQAVQQGGDASLYNLLTEGGAAATDVPIPEGALSFTANAVNFSGWYDYLNELALTVPELGGDLDSLILSFTGLNLRESVFSWTGDQLVTVTTGLSEVVEPGVPSENLLGDAAYLIEATNAAAAQRGLGALLQNLSQTASSLSDPEGGAGQAQRQQTTTIAGAQVTRFDVVPGTSILYAVNGGYALIATSEEAMQRTLTAQQGGGQDDLLGDVPNGATGFAYTNSQATFESLSQQLSSQIQMAAGMGGASGLNFEAVEAASGALEEFLSFVATRLESSTSYSENADGGIRSYSEATVRWTE